MNSKLNVSHFNTHKHFRLMLEPSCALMCCKTPSVCVSVSQLLFQRFTDGKTAIQDFLELFVSSQKLHHIRLVLMKNLQEIIRNETKTAQRLSEAHYLSLGLPEQVSLTTAAVLPPFLLVLGAHINTVPCIQPSLFCSDEDELLRMGVHLRGRKPIRLQPLNMQPRRHQPAPHWSHGFLIKFSLD